MHPRIGAPPGCEQPDPLEALAYRIMEAARAHSQVRSGAWRGLAWLDSGGPAAGPDAESVLTAFPVEVRRFHHGDGDLTAFIDALTGTDVPEEAPEDGAPRFRGGWIGHFAYEAVEGLEPVRLSAPRDVAVPLASWALHPVWFRVVPSRHRLELWSRLSARDVRVPDLSAWVHWAEDALRAPLDGTTPMLVPPAALERRPRPPRAATDALLQAAERSFTAERFQAAVRVAQDAIHEGEIFQANLAHRVVVPCAADPFAVYVSLRRINPSPFACFIEDDAGAIVSNSPERLFCVRRGPAGLEVSARPIAGTRRRGADAVDDARLAAELAASEKERAEHTMLVDLARNDLGRVSVGGSVRVDEFQVVEQYSHVHHLVSNVRGLLRAGVAWSDLLRALFPGGTITGAPKLRSVEVIDRVEPVARGVYTGSAGHINADGTGDVNILIRTLFVDGGKAVVFAGAGIVADSDPLAEYEETLHKAAAMVEALAATTPHVAVRP